MDAVGFTSRWVAAARALESARPDRLFADPLADRLAGHEGKALLHRFDASGNPYLAVRTRFFDDFLLEGAQRAHQVVILAAGMDARAFRLGWPAGTVVYEIERADVLSVKEDSIAASGLTPTCTRRVVEADLTAGWEEALAHHGFRADAPSVFSVEGLLVYLPSDVVHTLLERVAAIAPPGSRLGADLPGLSLLNSPYMTEYLAQLKAMGAPWQFGSDEPEDLFAQHGFDAQVSLPEEVSAAFGRAWPYPVVPREVPGVPRSYFVTATRAP